METSKNNKLWCRVYRAELSKRGGKGPFGSNLGPAEWGKSAGIADTAVREAKEKADSKV